MDNFVTLNSYEENVDKYFEGTPSVVDGNMKTWLDQFVKVLPDGADVFEIGSGTGRDADYLATKDVKVTCSDATSAFVERLRSNGKNAATFNALEDAIYPSGVYNGYLANAVFLHFTFEEAKTVIRKIWDALPHEGVLAFSVKMAPNDDTSSEWTESKLDSPRFFQYWKPEDVAFNVLSAGFTDLDFTFHDGWIFVIAMKRV